MAFCVRTQFLIRKVTKQNMNDSLIETQAFLVEIVGRFEFGMTERSERVCRGPGFLMVPVVEGELGAGAQLPLAVSVAAREGDAS